MSSNFSFLNSIDPQLEELAASAERYFADDPEVCVFKLRQLGEALASRAVGYLGGYAEDSQFNRLKQLEGRHGVTSQVLANFHALRKVGNQAAHAGGRVDHGDASTQLRNARELAIWYVAEFHNPDVKAPGFRLPSSGKKRRDAALEKELEARLKEETERTAAQLEALRKQLSQPQVATHAAVAQLLDAMKPAQATPVSEALQDFMDAPADFELQPIEEALDDKVRLLELTAETSGVVVASPSGDVLVLAWLAPEDDAIAWATPRLFEIHPVFGSLQIYAPTEAEASVGSATREESPLFAEVDDDGLVRGGLPKPLIPAVRRVTSEQALDELVPHLPEEAADTLYRLAAGYSLDEALEEMQRAEPEEAVDVEDWGSALEHPDSRRRFQLHEPGTPLEEALAGSLEAWRVYLHPDQEQLVRMQAHGPVKVLGGAGTGKTVALMHRTAFLVRNVFTSPREKIFVTTFTRNLASELSRNIAKLVPEEWHRSRIHVSNLHRWAVGLVKKAGQPVDIVPNEEREKLWQQAALDVPLEDSLNVDLSFVQDEWQQVVQAQDVASERDYLLADRRGRGLGLTRKQRRALWPLLERYRQLLGQRKWVEYDDVIRKAREMLEAGVVSTPFRAVLVDELQDFGPLELRLLRAMAPEADNDMFLVGDAHQRIYNKVAVLSRCGIEARGGRARRLKVNYRSTAQVARWALARLEGVTYDDMDAGMDDLRGYHSLRPGVAPAHHHFESRNEECDFIVSRIQNWLHEYAAESICITARHHDALAVYEAALDAAGIPTHQLEPNRQKSAEGVRLATMHRMKGLEFPCVLIAAVSDEVIDANVEDQGAPDEASERSLLYVAATRARDELCITGFGEQSPFVPTP